MDIKESLGKIEQYWQIIRNLHFHIEQEGYISPEEYALLDKYLKVISSKYAALVIDDRHQASSVIAKNEEGHGSLHRSATRPTASIPPIDFAEPEQEAEPVFQEEPVPSEVSIPEEVPILIPVELKAPAAPDSSISSFLERMLDDPTAVPVSPVVLEPRNVPHANPSFNDRMMASRQAKEDLNTKMKKTMAESISLNEKFEFIKELFGNNPVEYATALSMVDAREEEERAWNKLESEYAERFKWETKPLAVEKLKKAMQRRYA
jgi:hypothetical protein